MSGYIVCQSTSMFLEPTAAGRAPAHHFRRPPHPPRHRLEDRRYIHQSVSLPQQLGPNIPRHHSHHRSGGYVHPPAFHHQHSAGDYATDYYYNQPTHHQHHQLLPGYHVNGHHFPGTGILRLHEEIVAFYKDMRPRPEERQMRDDVVRRITEAVRTRWPGTRVEVFGSMKTGLYLPTSDIDLVVFHTMERTPFYEIRDELICRGICTDRTIKVLDNASVPIIKLTDQLTQVKIDIGFNIANGQRSAELVQSYIHQYPALPYIVIVLKQFLYQQELNEVYSGGISSYSLILLTISFLQSRAYAGRGPFGLNYGVLLIEFFELYARLFQCPRVIVSVNRAGCWQEVKPWVDNVRQPSLSIEDPLCSENDVARGSYNVSRVQAAFACALRHLYDEIHRPHFVCPSPKGMLSSIARVPAEIERYRNWVEERFPVPPVGNSSACAVSPGREPYEVSSSSSGISSLSPDPQPSTSCSDSLATSDTESDDEQANESLDDCAGLVADEALQPDVINSLNFSPSVATAPAILATTDTILVPTTTHVPVDSFPPSSLVSKIHDGDILEDFDEGDRCYDGSLYVGSNYKENPMAYDDVLNTTVQCAGKQAAVRSVAAVKIVDDEKGTRDCVDNSAIFGAPVAETGRSIVGRRCTDDSRAASVPVISSRKNDTCNCIEPVGDQTAAMAAVDGANRSECDTSKSAISSSVDTAYSTNACDRRNSECIYRKLPSCTEARPTADSQNQTVDVVRKNSFGRRLAECGCMTKPARGYDSTPSIPCCNRPLAGNPEAGCSDGSPKKVGCNEGLVSGRMPSEYGSHSHCGENAGVLVQRKLDQTAKPTCSEFPVVRPVVAPSS